MKKVAYEIGAFNPKQAMFFNLLERMGLIPFTEWYIDESPITGKFLCGHATVEVYPFVRKIIRFWWPRLLDEGAELRIAEEKRMGWIKEIS